MSNNNARKEIEKETGKPVITSKNAVDMSKFIEDGVKDPIIENTNSEDKKE